MRHRTETDAQMIKRVRASVRRAQAKARKAAKAVEILQSSADAFSASSLERSREAQSTPTSTRHQPAKPRSK